MNQNKRIQESVIFIAILLLTILSCQGVGGFNPFATATPTATATFTPSPTPTPTATHTPTPTPRPTGRLKEEQPEGQTVFTDYDNGYQLSFPRGWSVVIPGKDDLQKILDSVPEQEGNISDVIEIAKSAEVNNLIRAFAFNFKAQQGIYTPNINIAYDTSPLVALMSLEDLLDFTLGYFPSLGIEVVHSEIKETSSGIETGRIEAEWTAQVSANEKVDLSQVQVFFRSGEGYVIMTYTTVQDATVDLGDDMDELIESIQLLE